MYICINKDYVSPYKQTRVETRVIHFVSNHLGVGSSVELVCRFIFLLNLKF